MLCYDADDVLTFGVKWNLLGMIATRISRNIVSAHLFTACLQPTYVFYTSVLRFFFL